MTTQRYDNSQTCTITDTTYQTHNKISTASIKGVRLKDKLNFILKTWYIFNRGVYKMIYIFDIGVCCMIDYIN